MTDELSQKLRTMLDQSAPPIALEEVYRSRGGRRWAAPLVAVLSFLGTLALFAVLYVVGGLQGSDVAPMSSSPGLPPASDELRPENDEGLEWRAAPDHAVLGRTFPSTVWTGTEYIVWGGEGTSEDEFHDDGAAFDPVAQQWRTISDGPLAARSEHVAVWSGTEMLVCCGREVGSGATAAAYDPEQNTWREIAGPPLNATFMKSIWVDGEMIVFGGVMPGDGAESLVTLGYNPSTDSWRPMDDLPVALGRTGRAAPSDDEVYAWSASTTGVLQSLNPRRGSWEVIEPLPDQAPIAPDVCWAGDRLVVWGLANDASNTPDSIGAFGAGLIYEPSSQTWTAMPPAPLDPVAWSEGTASSQAIACAGDLVLVWTGWLGTDSNAPYTNALLFHLEDGKWDLLPQAPVPALGLWHDPILWTGQEFLVYGARLFRLPIGK